MKTSGVQHRFRNDMMLVGGLLLVALVAFAVFRLTMKEGALVVVTVNGEKTATYSLAENRETVITTDGAKENTLVIENGTAYMRRADCPDKICVGHRPISQVGETIVCLPHKVVVSIE